MAVKLAILRRSALTGGIKYITTRSDYPKNIEGTANAFGADQCKGH
jgi:hypothetical protein